MQLIGSKGDRAVYLEGIPESKVEISGQEGNPMKRRLTTLLLALFCLPAVPGLAQTTIGGGVCNSSTLNGTYEILLSGRQVTSTGAASKVFQAVGTAAFDGLSKVTLNLTANTVTTSQSLGTPLVYAGSYSMQSNCVGAIGLSRK